MANDLFNSFMTGLTKKVGLGSSVDVLSNLMPLILELEDQYEKAKLDPEFWEEMDYLWSIMSAGLVLYTSPSV